MTPRLPWLLLSLPLITASAAAQANFLWVYPVEDGSAATYVVRPDGGNPAEGLTEFSADFFRGIGDTSSGVCEVLGMFHYAADEDIATPETYDIVFRSYDAANAQPDTSSTGMIASITGLPLPVNPAGGRGGWILTDTFATPVTIPCDQTFYAGVNLYAANSWPSDGQSQWAAYIDPLNAGGTVGQNPRAGTAEICWSVSTTVSTDPYTTMNGLMVDSPVFQIGGIDPTTTLNGGTAMATDPSYGLNGMFPDIAMPRQDGLTLRVKDSVVPSGVALFAIADGWGMPPLAFAFPGLYQLDIVTTGLIGVAPLSGGVAELPIAAPGSVPISFLGTNLYFQGAVVNVNGNARLGNAQAVSF